MRRLAWILALLLLAALGWQVRAQWLPMPPARITMLTDRLFEYGAVSFVHGRYDGPERALFDCAARGAAMTAAQSARYRAAFADFLQGKQALFGALDENLQLRRDFRMDQPNNTGGSGLAGLHDQHDLSAQANLANIGADMRALPAAGPVGRVRLANDAFKDLTDLMVHMAPAVHSRGLLVAEPLVPDLPEDVAGAYMRFYSGMKAAQAAPVNGADYWAAVESGLVGYADLVTAVQARIRAGQGPVSRGLSGGWLSPQTVAPVLSAASASARVRRAGERRACAE